jgi:ADP-ribose pyrophosphatase YjhB (NUDIX family)
MIQSYKIHINDNTVFLEDEAHWQFKNYIIKDKELYIPYVDEAQTKQLVEDIYNKYQGHTFFVIASDLSALKTSFFNQFKLIVAGGGVVFNKNNEMLLIHRRGFWDLPKGKIEMGEVIREGAAREVKEETGVKIKLIDQKICCSYHTYNIENKRILKETHWFLMKGKSGSILKPQTKEGIEKVEWVKQENIAPYIEKSYSNIVDIITIGFTKLQSQQSLF